MYQHLQLIFHPNSNSPFSGINRVHPFPSIGPWPPHLHLFVGWDWERREKAISIATNPLSLPSAHLQHIFICIRPPLVRLLCPLPRRRNDPRNSTAIPSAHCHLLLDGPLAWQCNIFPETWRGVSIHNSLLAPIHIVFCLSPLHIFNVPQSPNDPPPPTSPIQ